MKEHIAKLHRLIAASQATMSEYSEMMKVMDDIKSENERIEKQLSLLIQTPIIKADCDKSLLKKSPPIEQTGGGNGELWEKELFESSLRPVLKKYPTSDEFIIASNQSDNVKL